MEYTFTAGEHFLHGQGRLVERRLLATRFHGASPVGVVDALRGYQNEDGGFGHALEPDKRCPASLPVDVETAFAALVAANTVDAAMVLRACDFLARTAADAAAGGAVAPASPVIESFPCAAHWSDWTDRPGLNPTAGFVGSLHRLGVEHPWLAEGTRYCWRTLEFDGLPTDAHALAETPVFLDHVPERDRADEHAAGLRAHLAEVPVPHLDPEAPGYGLSPLDLAPTPGSRWRGLFTDAQIDAHLDHLARMQQPDGGWPITWAPPTESSLLEWRGIVTLGALSTLSSYDRLNLD